MQSSLIFCYNDVLRNMRQALLKRNIARLFSCTYTLCKESSILQKKYSGIWRRYYASDSLKDMTPNWLESNHRIGEKGRPLKIYDVIQKDYLKIEEVVSLLCENMCEDLCVIKVDLNKTKFHYVDYFVVTSGRSVRHLKSMAFLLCSKFKEKVREMQGSSTAVVEGEDCNDWLVLDIGNIVVHFMLPDIREKYELEKLWTLGPAYDDQMKEMLNSNFDDNEIVLPFKSTTLTGKAKFPSDEQ